MTPGPAREASQPEYDLVTVGESMIVLTPPHGERLLDAPMLEAHTAGAESNVAVHLAQLGRKVAWVSRVGRDPFGERLLRTFSNCGVDVSQVAFDAERPTGVYFKDHTTEMTQVHYYRRGSAASALQPAAISSLLVRARVIHLTGITPALSPSCNALVRSIMAASAVPVFFDVNYRPTLWSKRDAPTELLALAGQADTVFVGRDEAELLWGTATPEDIHALLPDVPCLVVKDGAVGATAYVGTHRTFVPALRVDVVEHTGAGDAFAAGFIHATFDAASPTTALRWGHLLAALALGSVADHHRLPDGRMLARATAGSDLAWRMVDPRRLSVPSAGSATVGRYP